MFSEDADLFIEVMKEDCEKAVSHLLNEFNGIRAGRANPHVLDKIKVEYYGTQTPINQVANITVPEARIIAIAPWDASVRSEIIRAINMSDIGITPNDDGKIIRLVFPVLTEERRRELCKDVRRLAEDTKVTLRNARRSALDGIKKLKNDKLLTEDEVVLIEKEVQKILDDFSAKVDKNSEEKEKEILTI